MKYRFLLFTAGLSLSCLTLSAQWSAVGSTPPTTSTAAYTGLVKDNSGNYYLSYSMGASGGVVQKFDGTSWTQLGGPTTGSASYGNIAVNVSGEVFHGYQDGANSSNLSVRKYDPVTSSWSSIGTAISGSVVNYQSLKVNPTTGLPVVSYNQSGIRMKRYDGSAWQDIGAQPLVTGNGVNHSAVIGNNDTVYVAVQIGTAYSVYKSHVNAVTGTAWQLVGAAGFVSGGSSNQFTVSLAIDNNNNLYLGYRSVSANSGKIAVSKFDGSSWSDLGTPYFSTGNVEHISMVVSAMNTPYVIYRDNTLGKAVVQYFNGTTWVSLGEASATIGNYNALVINNSGVPVAAFCDGTGVSGGIPAARIYTGTALAIKLGQIAAVNLGTANQVSWTTLDEAANDEFIVERSRDGIDFRPIGNQKTDGIAKGYRFSDTKPYAGKNYYRLQLRNGDGTTAYSTVVSANLPQDKPGILCYPNPFERGLSVVIPPAASAVVLSLYDLTGRRVWNAVQSGSDVPQTVYLDLQQYPAGNYILDILADDKHVQQKIQCQ